MFSNGIGKMGNGGSFMDIIFGMMDLSFGSNRKQLDVGEEVTAIGFEISVHLHKKLAEGFMFSFRLFFLQKRQREIDNIA